VATNPDGSKTIRCTDGTSVTVANGAPGANGSSLGVNVTAFHGSDFVATLGANANENAGTFPVNIQFTAATADVAGVVTVQFQVTQKLASGAVSPVLTIPAPQFTVAKLVPAAPGEASNHWVPYLTRTRVVGATQTGLANPPGTVFMIADREPNGVINPGGTLTSNGGGSYTYVFKTVLGTAAWKLDGGLVGYDRSLTHRVAILLGGSINSGATGSAAFDFVPDGSAVTETRDIVQTAACRQCHGAGFAAHGGNRTEVQVCVTCHNPTSVDVYSNNNVEFRQLIHNIHAGGEKASVAGPDGIVWDDPATPVDESADNLPYFIGAGAKQDWWKLEFPAMLANCTKCHQGTGKDVDNWKTKPGTAACTSCHDLTDVTLGNTAASITHPALPQTDDSACKQCHQPSGDLGPAAFPIPRTHDWTANDPRMQQEFVPTITMTPPANGTYYVAGEAPKVTVVLTDATTGQPIDHTRLLPPPTGVAAQGCPSDGGPCPTWDGYFRKVVLLVHGPRAQNFPVLTAKARSAVVAASAGPWDLSDGGTLAVSFDQGFNLHVPVADAPFGDYFLNGAVTVSSKQADGGSVFPTPTAATAAQVASWLNANAAFTARGIAYTDEKSGRLAIRSRNRGVVNAVQLQPSLLTTAAFGGDLTAHLSGGNASTPTNDLRKTASGGVNDALVSYASGSVSYQLDPVDDLAPGTYTVGLEITGRGSGSGSAATSFSTPTVGFLNFQVGQADEELPVARNCNTCHQSPVTDAGMVYDASGHHKILGDHAMDQCGGCHDYQPQIATGDWSGAKPISRRIHALHDGENLTYPIATVGHADEYAPRAWGILYPQDIRTCETCHVKGTTSGTWSTNAGRIACGGCHDADDATAHIKIMTYDPTPADPYSGDEVQACTVCHQ
jgi:hypothetical protein